MLVYTEEEWAAREILLADRRFKWAKKAAESRRENHDWCNAQPHYHETVTTLSLGELKVLTRRKQTQSTESGRMHRLLRGPPKCAGAIPPIHQLLATRY
jgi:hypothetical protein